MPEGFSPQPPPLSPGPLIGRASEVEALRRHLLRPDVRLVTVTGPGGVGKTRLALEAAAETVGWFADGIGFVDLAPLVRPDEVLPAIASALGIGQHGGLTLATRLKEVLCEARLLLFLDNFEHVVSAATDVARLLEACPQMRALATSREALQLRWEHVYPVAPLEAPRLAAEETPPVSDLPHLLRYPAVALFANRAQAADPRFTPSARNLGAVAALCARLDGLPLAIELAASRVHVLPPAALLARLEAHVRLLGRGLRDLPGRQQSLHDTITWSYDLLTAPEQSLFRRLAVFAGGWPLPAAEAVAEDAGALELLDSLTSKSLVRRLTPATADVEEPAGEPRFGMLDTIRDFALERLTTSGEAEAAANRHAAYYLGVAEAAEAELSGAEQVACVNRLELERENVHAALRWLNGRKDAAAAWRMVGALHRFWQLRARASDTQHLLAAALAIPVPEPPTRALLAARARAVHAAAVVATRSGLTEDANRLVEELLSVRRRLGDPAGIAAALSLAGSHASRAGDLHTARAMYEESAARWRTVGDPVAEARVLSFLGLVASRQGDRLRARSMLNQALARLRGSGDVISILNPLRNLAALAFDEGDLATAREYALEVLAAARRLGDPRQTCNALTLLGRVALVDDAPAEAQPLLEEALALATEANRTEQRCGALDSLGDVALLRRDFAAARAYLEQGLQLRLNRRLRRTIPWTLARFAALAAAEGAPERALRLAGASVAGHRAVGAAPAPARLALLERALAPARAALSAAAQEAAWAEGAALSLDAAVVFALNEPPGAPDAGVERGPSQAPAAEGERPRPPAVLVDPLTAREREVARLLSLGMTNRQIAGQLVIAEGTARIHVANLMGKLGFRRRAEVAAWAVRRGLGGDAAAVVA